MSLVQPIRDYPSSEIRLAIPESPPSIPAEPDDEADDATFFFRSLTQGPLSWERGEAANAVFRGLVGGRYALVDSERSATGAFWLLRTAPPTRRGLSEIRLRRLQKAATGKQAKQVAADLEISEACLSGSVASALQYLGFESREEFMWFCRERGVLAPPSTFRSARFPAPHGELVVAVFPRGPAEVGGPFTPAERAIVMRVLSGMSNREIAADRGVSVCTVQNQVAAVLRRAAVESRWDLIAKSMAWAPSAAPPDRLPAVIARRFSDLAWSKARAFTVRD
jgi:DNA-binding NarL/FixJ family response regulator